MRLRNWKKFLAVLGVSIMLSGCVEIEETATVLEDGRIIYTTVIQPKNSMLTLLSLGASEIRRPKLRQDLRTFGNVCKLVDEIYSAIFNETYKETFARQGIPYSAVSVPTKFEFSAIAGNGCSIQVGPYDPRTLPAEFADEVLGIRIEPATGLHRPYRMSVVSIDEVLDELPSSASMDAAELQAICSGELEPALCQQDLRILSALLRAWKMEVEGSDKFGNFLSDPGMLGGAAELLRMVLKSAPVTLRIPDNTAVRMVHGTSALDRGQGWIWRGSVMEWITENPVTSLEIRPTRLPAPSTR